MSYSIPEIQLIVSHANLLVYCVDYGREYQIVTLDGNVLLYRNRDMSDVGFNNTMLEFDFLEPIFR